MRSRKLLLVDGTAVVYRAFYAIRELSTRSGTPTNALFGFVRMLTQLKETWLPTHWGVMFDGGLPRERRELLESYKAQRPPMPDSLRSQLPLVQEYLNLAGVPWTRMEGEESDDVMASLAEWSRPDCDAILIATSDKDMFQLVDEKVKVVPVAGKDGVLDLEGVKAKTGVLPAQIVDWLSMVGDNADNIPGVPGIGPKTAAKLLEQLGTVDAVFEHISEAGSSRLQELLAEHRSVIARNRAMMRLRTDLVVDLADWNKLELRQPASSGSLLTFLEELELHSLAKGLREPELFPV